MTNIADLGVFDEPIAVCGGIYSNLEALTAFADEMARRRIPASRIIHTGDVVAYCADPVPCSEFLRSAGWHAIKGNVEEQLGARLDSCGCGFGDGTACDITSGQWYAYADAAMTDPLRDWMLSLPDQLQLTMSGKTIRVVHGSVTVINRFMYASCNDADFTSEFAAAGNPDIIIAGHTGIPFTKNIDGKVWHNSGALGVPANDGTPRVWYSLFEPAGDDVHISHHALEYDHATTARKMRENRLPEGYAIALETGLLPALDNLGEPERAATGAPLELS